MVTTVVNLRCIWSSRTVELDLFKIGNSSLYASMGMVSSNFVCSKEPLCTKVHKIYVSIHIYNIECSMFVIQSEVFFDEHDAVSSKSQDTMIAVY